MVQDQGRPKLLDILVVDDNEADVRLFWLATADSPVKVRVLREGAAALQWVRQAAAQETTVPDLIVLDLHLPMVDGFEILDHVKREERLRSIPVVILSTSPREEDVFRAYRGGAASYVVKPSTLEDYLRVIRFLVEYWGQHVTLPKMAGC